MSSSTIGGANEFSHSLEYAMEALNQAGAGNFGAAYTMSLVAPQLTTAHELSALNADVEQYGQLQANMEDLTNSLRSHANDQTFVLSDSYREVFDKSIVAYRKQIADADTPQDKKTQYQSELEKLQSLYEKMKKNEKIAQSDAAGGSALIAEAKGWIIPHDKTRDVISTKVKFLNEEYQQRMEKMTRSIENQFAR